MAVEEAPKGSISEDKTSIIQTPITNTNPRLPREGDEVDDEPEEGEIVGETDSASSNPSKGLVQQRHSLEHSWTFWFYNTSAKSKQADWGRFMSLIYTFPTVEDFWSIYNNICQPSRLAVGADFYCFKCNIEPKWEDPVCANGGKWTMTLPNKGKADTCWLYTLLAMIGEQFEHGDDICGAVVNVRPKYRISIWTKNASNEAAQLSIGKQWKEILDCNESLGFIFHEDAKNKGAKNKYTL